MKEIGTVPYDSQYPYAVYDERAQAIYYSSGADIDASDQIYKKDVATKNVGRITDDLYAINCIVPQRNNIFVVGVSGKAKEIVLNPVWYDKDGGKGIDLGDGDEDNSIKNLYYDPETKHALCSARSAAEHSKRMAAQMDDQKYIEPENTVYEIDTETGNYSEIFTTDASISALAETKDAIIYQTSAFNEDIFNNDEDGFYTNRIFVYDKKVGVHSEYAHNGGLDNLKWLSS
ncbi:MAG: hypothetical protein LBO70_00625 [Clostridiales Family XIII bacterium]|nr:hypothetical protein [Clostridiales Family XIII bacterium]